MSDQIETHYQTSFKSGIELLVQQMSSKMRGAVREEAQVKKREFYDQIGAVAARRGRARHADTEYVDTPHRRRSVSTVPYDISDLIDDPDKVRVLNDPTNAYSRAFAAALNRGIDREIAEAALGSAWTGETGTTEVVLPAAQKISAGGDGFTLAKLKQGVKMLKGANAIMPGDTLYCAWTSHQEDEFADTTEVKSIDYNTQRVLVNGGVDEFYKVNFIRIEDAADGAILPLVSTTRSCVLWVKSGLLLGMNKDITAKVDVLPTKHYSTQVYASMDVGATRMQEEKVVQIDCVES